jgi:hypothetical protein
MFFPEGQEGASSVKNIFQVLLRKFSWLIAGGERKEKL